MKVLHIADWHIGQFNGPVEDGVNLRSLDTVKCLGYMVEKAREEQPDLVCISGDVFHQEQIGPVRYSDEMVTATRIIDELSKVSKFVVVMRGTPNHDGAGQFRVLTKMLEHNKKVAVVTTPQVISNATAQAIMNEALKYQGWKYVYGGSNPNTSFDCSGLVQWCYGKVGISLPRTAQAQYDATQHLPLSQAKAGDLVFFHSTYNAGSYVTHVGILVSPTQMYHAGDPIGYADLSSSYWQQHLIGAGPVSYTHLTLPTNSRV